jgi:lipoprotein-anchoring transpeptidase ErfK/SrfK
MKAANQNSRARLIASALLAALALILAVPANAQESGVAGRGRARRIVLISIPDRKLAVLEDGDMVASFPVAVGAEISPSPTGEFEIVNRLTKPTYYHQGVVIPPGKDNPIGTRWVGLSEKGFGIHGTNAPKSIGHAASHGCIRLRNRDMERLFTMLRVGDTVEIRGERDEETAEIFGAEGDGSTLAAAQTGSLQAGGGQ